MKSLKLPKILPLEYPPRAHARQARRLALSHVASPPLASQYGVNLKYQRHTANNLNQYTSRSVPGYVEVLGTANSQATVTVNGTPTHRRGDYFRAEVAVDNSSGPVWQAITNLAVLNNGTSPDIVTNVVGNTLVAARQETFTHDSDGNLTADSRWSYSWNAGNRLVSMESAAGVPSAAKRRLEFSYDPQGRRIQKVVYTNNGTIYLPALTNRFVYDGWNLVAVMGADNSLLRSFAWGTDLSGTFQGVGGVGGLLWIHDLSTLNNQPSTHFVAHDGNGNVSLLVNATDGTETARYEYGPFGEVIRATGPMAKVNPFRWSTRYQDDETAIVMYPRRPYNASTGRLLTHDPMEEDGGPNLYAAFRNNPLQFIDALGLWNSDIHHDATREWAQFACDYPNPAAEAVATADNGVDGLGIGGTGPVPWGDQSYHFNRNTYVGIDSRLQHWAAHAKNARNACTASRVNANPEESARQLGISLHPLQDLVAHGDYGINNKRVWILDKHNWMSPQKDYGSPGDYPDTTYLDADGPNGRATSGVMQYRFGNDEWNYAIYKPGTQRINLTGTKTKSALTGFRNYVKVNGGCRCKKYFNAQ